MIAFIIGANRFQVRRAGGARRHSGGAPPAASLRQIDLVSRESLAGAVAGRDLRDAREARGTRERREVRRRPSLHVRAPAHEPTGKLV
ncbi:hypothetical protein NX871_32460, partial [Burkholderia thailandensis]|uniref:hypothetical protein n=1 Tax=Burkholderia thailandensis TaxID=57975 RepID=UPI00217D4407